jgi:hypothetical protein
MRQLRPETQCPSKQFVTGMWLLGGQFPWTLFSNTGTGLTIHWIAGADGPDLLASSVHQIWIMLHRSLVLHLDRAKQPRAFLTLVTALMFHHRRRLARLPAGGRPRWSDTSSVIICFLLVRLIFWRFRHKIPWGSVQWRGNCILSVSCRRWPGGLYHHEDW